MGITGSLEQRWAQLEEAWAAVGSAPAGSRPSFKVAHVTRCAATGQLKRTPSWHSFGSSLEESETEEERVGALEEQQSRAVKVRRVTDNTDAVYERA